MANEKFIYDHEHKSLKNTGTGNAMDVHLDQFSIDTNVVTEPADDTSG